MDDIRTFRQIANGRPLPKEPLISDLAIIQGHPAVGPQMNQLLGYQPISTVKS
jgi:hypothetical protein